MTNQFKVSLSLLVLTLTMSLAKAEAKTKPNPAVEANVPFAFQVGNRVLPAGNYRFELATGSPKANDTMSVILVRNREAHIYQAIAAPVNVGAGLSSESRAVFSNSDQHALVALWERGNRIDVKPAMLSADDNADDWSDSGRLVNVSFHPVQ